LILGARRGSDDRQARKGDQAAPNETHHLLTSSMHARVSLMTSSVRQRGMLFSGAEGRRAPAMAAGLTDHGWSLREWLTYPSLDRTQRAAQGPERQQQS